MDLELGVGSHVPVLASVVHRTTGPVLECGMGMWSTPLLHCLCKMRKLVSLETDHAWLEKFSEWSSPTHEKKIVRDWATPDEIVSHEWSVVFVDHSPGEERIHTIERLRGRAQYIIAHDTEADIPPSGGNYGWAKLKPFRYSKTYKHIRPWTTVYSDIVDGDQFNFVVP